MHTEPSTDQPSTSCPATETPDTPVAPTVDDAARSASDPADSIVELSTTRLAALDHADALSTIADSDTPPACRQSTASDLATVFELAARLLARKNHTRQTVALALHSSEIRILEAAHRQTAASHDDVDLSDIYRDHARRLQTRRCEGDAR